MTRHPVPLLASALSLLLASSGASAQTAVELFERGAARLTLDGLIREWSGFGQLRAVDDRSSVTAGLASWRGTDDASFGYALARDDDGLWIAAEVRDDALVRSAAHAAGDDRLSLALAVTSGGRTVAYEVDLYPGEPGSFPGAVRFRVGGRGDVRGAARRRRPTRRGRAASRGGRAPREWRSMGGGLRG